MFLSVGRYKSVFSKISVSILLIKQRIPGFMDDTFYVFVRTLSVSVNN